MKGMGKFKAPAKSFTPKSPTKVHPAATHVRLPDTSTGPNDPAPMVPGVGKI